MIYTETAEQNSGRLNNSFDKNKVQRELDLQREVSQTFSRNVGAARAEINRHLDTLKEKLEKGEIGREDYEAQTRNWQRGQILLNSIATGLSAPTESGAGIAAATASPALSYEIGQYFKGLAKENAEGKLTARQETAHILAHAVLGAAVSAAGNNNALAGAIGAGGAEAAAPVVSRYLYGESDGSKLTAEQKETVSAITGLLGTTTGAAIGSSSTNALQGSLNADSAVRNNSALTVINTGRKIIQKGRKANKGNVLDLVKPTAEAGLIVAVACAISGECSAQEVLNDIWNDEFGNEESSNQAGQQESNTTLVATGSPQIEPPDPEPDKTKKRGEKGKTFRGGSKKQRDNWYGYNDRKFQNWWHREGKKYWGKDIDNATEAKMAWEEWNALGKPNPK